MSSATLTPIGYTTTQSFSASIPDWANQFFQAKKVEGVSSHTLTFYKQQLGHFLRYCEAQVLSNVEEITPNDIRKFLLWHEETGHNPGGLHAAFRVLRTFLLWYENEVEPDQWKNPIKKIKAPKLGQEPLEPADLDIVASMVKTCKTKSFLDLRDRAILLFLLDTGTRAREVLQVNLEDINLVNGSVLIRVGKGRKPRMVYLGKTGRKALRAYLKIRKANNPALWVTQAGERLKYGGLRKIVVNRSELAGVVAPTLHSFRRAFAINMLRAGVDIYSLQNLMGHSDLKTLQRYLKHTTEDLQFAHEKGSPVDNHIV